MSNLPSRRESETFAPRIVGPDGSHRLHVTFGRVNGRVAEVWIDMHKEGAPLRGAHHALARLASLSLQACVPLETVSLAMVDTDGGPSGTVTDCDGIDATDSPADLVGRLLERETKMKHPLRVYVAGNSAERLTVARWAIESLRGAGVTITHDWTSCEGYDRKSTSAERRAWAQSDIDGVKSADIVWVLMAEGKSEGASVELGAALALGKRVIVSGPHARADQRIFALLARIVDSHAEALAIICADT